MFEAPAALNQFIFEKNLNYTSRKINLFILKISKNGLTGLIKMK
jgi:hypothetical protein